MWTRWACGLCCLLASMLSMAADPPEQAGSASRRFGGDLFIGGGSITQSDPVSGDFIAAAGSLDVDAPVTGDAITLGGKVRIGGDVGRSVYAAAGQLSILGKVGHNVRMAGGQAELGPKSEVAGNVSIAGGQARLLGTVRGHVQAAGERVLIDGPVTGDVVATARQVELGPNARIGGKLRYRSGEPLRQDPAAQVTGGVDVLVPALGGASEAARRPAERHPPQPATGYHIAWVWTLGLMVLAGVLLAALPGFYAHVARTLRERPGMSLLLGFALLVCTPVAALLMMISLVGIPLGLFTTAVYLALLPVAYVSSAIALGDWALTRWQSERAAGLRWRLLAAALAVALLAALGAIPWLGGVVAFAALLGGLGALLLQTRRLAPGA
jgi:cytoskeletal protein CcmA (bactofilin family)